MTMSPFKKVPPGALLRLAAALLVLSFILLIFDKTNYFVRRIGPMTFDPPKPMEKHDDVSSITERPFPDPDYPDPGESTSNVKPFPNPDRAHPESTADRNKTEILSSQQDQSGPAPFDVADPLKGYVGVPDGSKQLNLHCGVCALVSSSGQLLHYKAGNEIDQADCVIRMNEAPVLGFEEHVGSKTALRVMCFRSINQVPENTSLFSRAGNSTLLGWGPPRDMDSKKGKSYQKLKRLQTSYPDLEAYMLTEDRMRHADRVFEQETRRPRAKSGAWLSTGWFTMLVAMEICDVIKVYGMINEDYCRTHPDDQTLYHYFSQRWNECGYYKAQQGTRNGGHRMITEKAIFARWASRSNITFLYPSWNP
ncbi:alpha-N-acetyl-neuraminyl-2,3-beta-galactosyl-1,3-N-acetyl-galactosaminide alpha-2,6-sialyltransferase-like [Branchiostoma lanceolatum]|uniref:alpha-N-acetyl-neuraminyl-2,3-beta-galactosyl-1, 3-N-acetyl-galactosaminide alpha-2,6-sialyltransferase-like n=1 Tax=Branchiostoma lanceolatum TaxID=7740 RepID=UPI003453BD2D